VCRRRYVAKVVRTACVRVEVGARKTRKPFARAGQQVVCVTQRGQRLYAAVRCETCKSVQYAKGVGAGNWLGGVWVNRGGGIGNGAGWGGGNVTALAAGGKQPITRAAQRQSKRTGAERASTKRVAQGITVHKVIQQVKIEGMP